MTCLRDKMFGPPPLDPPLTKGGRNGGFTLVEMVIVLAIVLMLVTLVLPAASTMWRQRRVADAQNLMSGLLMTARAQALQSDFGESGLFFYVDDKGTQRVAAINQDAQRVSITDPATGRRRFPYIDPQLREAWASVFSVVPGKTYALPSPMRAVPRYVVDDPASAAFASMPNAAALTFSPEELANNDVYRTPTPTADQAQRHRNFFTLIYDSNGRLQVRRDVYVRDIDSDPTENPGGDVTGLRVPPPTDTTGVANGFVLTSNAPAELDPTGNDITVVSLIIDDTQTAINFPSVDGVMIYDDSEFAAAGGPEDKRNFVTGSGQPFYIQRVTGTVVRGPVGETIARAP